MQLNVNSQHRQRVGKKIHKAQQNIFRQHTRKAELLALSQKGSHPARFQQERKYLIVSLVFSHLGFWSDNLFLIAPFPDLCLLVPFDVRIST